MAKYKITYSDDLPEGTGGRCYYPFPYILGLGICKIVVKTKYKEDIGIHNHEIKHAEQYSSSWFHSLKYRYNASYRYKCELEAYAEQIKAYNYQHTSQAKWIVLALANKYNLDMSIDDITNDVHYIIVRNIREQL